MAIATVQHLYTATQADGTHADMLQPSNWNAQHLVTITGVVGTNFVGTNASATLDANGMSLNVAAGGGGGFTNASQINHASLSNLEGGLSGNYFHLGSGLYNNLTNAPTFITTGAAASLLGADGAYHTVAGGSNVTNYITSGVYVQGSGTFVKTDGTVQFANGGGVSFGLSTDGIMTAVAPAQTGNFLTNNASTSFAPVTTLASTNVISGTINATAWNTSLVTSAAGFAHTHNYAATNATNFAAQTATPSQTTGASSVLANNGAFVTVLTGSAGLQAAGNYVSTNATSGFAVQTATTVAANSTQVLYGNGAWAAIPAQTGNFLTNNASTSFAPVTTIASTNVISGTINATTWNTALVTSAAGFAHTHTYQPAGNYISTGATSGYGTNVVLQTTTANASNSFLAANGAWTTVGGGAVGTQYATQSVSTGASSHVLYGDGRWASVAGGVGGGIGTLNGNTAGAQTITYTGGVTGTSATDGMTFGIAGTYGAQFQAAGNYASTNATNFASQTATPSQTTGASSVHANNGAWVTVLTGSAGLQAAGNYQTTGNYMSTNASGSFAATTALATSNAITGTINSTTWNIGLNTSANGFTHTHAYLATNSGIQSVNGSAANSTFNITSGNGLTATISTNGVTFAVNTSALTTNFQTTGNYASTNFSGFADQTVSTVTASNSFLAGDGGFYSIAGGGVTNNYSGGVIGAINSTGGSNVVSAGTVYLSASGGGGVNFAMSTGAASNGSHTLYLAHEADSYNTGFFLQGNTAGSSSFAQVGEGAITFYGGNNITLSGTNANIVSIIGAAGGGGGVTLPQFDYPKAWKMATSGSTLISTQVHLKHLEMGNNCAISAIDVPLQLACGSTTSGTQTVSINISAIFYTMNGGTLSPFNGATFATNTTFTSNATGSIVGIRMFHLPMLSTTVLTPNDYYIGYQVGLGGWSSTAVTNIVASGSVPSLFMEFGNQSITTTGRGGVYEIQGMIAASMSNTTNTWATTAINMGAASWYRANIPVLIRNAAY